MKKILLLISFVILSLVTYALNPFAYALSSTLSDDQSTLTVNYKLNATATSVTVEIYNGQTKVKTVDCTSEGLTKGAYSVDISTADLPKGTTLTWKVNVKGALVSSPTKDNTEYSFYHPSSVDIDNNPENENFGTIYTLEGLDTIRTLSKATYDSYKSYVSGAGVYVFNAAFEHQKTPSGTDGYNGGVDFASRLARRKNPNGGKHLGRAYSPRRVRVSRDGRVFISSQCLGNKTLGDNTYDNTVLWEFADLKTGGDWTKVIQGAVEDKTDAQFYAAPNVAFDTYGSGENLELAMISSTLGGWEFTGNAYRLSTYLLGENKSNPELTTIDMFDNLGGTVVMIYDNAQVTYDDQGGVWVTQGRGATPDGGTNYPSLVHFNANGKPDLVERRLNRYGAGFCFNPDYTKVIISGKYENNISGISASSQTAVSQGQASIYSVSYDKITNAPTLEYESTINFNIGNYLNDFAWDYADNIYAVSHNGEKIVAFALPHNADKVVSTPAATRHSFELTKDAQLNPFAYDLSSTLSNDQKTLTVNYSLNANATSVNIQIVDGEEVVRTISSAGTTKGAHTLNVSTEGLPAYTYLSWQVEVNGNSVVEPTELATSYSFYHPSSVDIDNNPENEKFGLILTNEAMQKVKGLSGYSSYMSYTTGAGIYAFTPSFEPIQNGSNYGFNGGKDFVISNDYGITNENGTIAAYTPRRIRISEDGRIFITSLNPLKVVDNKNNAYLWEVNPQDLNSWTPVFQGTGINSDAELTVGGAFMAGANTGFDVMGSGDDLKLLMLSAKKEGIETTLGKFECSEYNLGSATEWTTTPSRKIDNLSKYVVNFRGAQVQYDEVGGVWLCQYRNTASDAQPSLVYFDNNGEERFKEILNNRASGAIRFNEDYSKVIIAGDGSGGTKAAAIYTITKDANGVPTGLVKERVIDMTSMGVEICDFAFDYAGNLYVCGNSGEKLAVWAMPYDGQVITPAASKNVFQLTPAIDNANLLNPYAYNLYRTEENGHTKLHFFLNTHAKRARVILMDQNKNEYVLRDYPTDNSTSVPYHQNGYATVITDDDIARLKDLGLPEGEPITWKVEVEGLVERTEPILTTNAVPFNTPNSVAIDKDPESPYFGRVLMVEAGHGNSSSSYYSSKNGVIQGGVYAFKPELVNVNAKIASYMPWDVNYENIPYTGSKDFTRVASHGAYNLNGHQPWMIRISDDGRIFVSSGDARADGCMVWEVDPANLNSWSNLIQGDIVKYTNQSESTNGVYHVKNSSGNFLAGVNCSMDVKGSGEDLKLLLYSTDRRGMKYSVVANYRLDEYAIGQQARFTGTPTQITHFGTTRYGHIPYHAKVTYDEDRGFWFGGFNSNGDNDIIFAHARKTNSGYTRKSYGDNKDTYSGGSGVLTHMVNGEKILFKGVENNTLIFYKVTYDATTGEPYLNSKSWGIKLSSNATCRCNDFAVDYANNLYITDGHNYKLMTVALPYSGSVTTPAAERYSFTVGDPVPCIVAYNLSCTPNLNSRTYNFSFCANMSATEGMISFHKNDGSETLLAEYTINQQITQGTNIVSYEMDEIDEMLNGEKDIIWKLHLRAESSVFGEIYKSEQLNTAYATIDASPTSDFFGQIYAANQQNHTFSNQTKTGEVKVWTPNGAAGNIYTTKPTITNPGLELPYRPGVAPDGTVYFTDGGKNGNVYMMNPNDNTVKSFYANYTQKVGQDAGNRSLFYDGNQVVGAPSSSAHVYSDNNGVKLFTTRSEIYTATVGENSTELLRHNNGYFIYNLDQTAGVGQHTWTGQPTAVTVKDDNIYSTLFTVVGTSHGAWLCQHRRKGKDMKEARSLMFYGNDGTRKYVSTNVDMINGTPGSGLAMSKDEKTLAITSGDAGIMLFDVTWNGDVPTLTHRQTYSILNNGFITSLNFDYAGNLVATIGDTYNDSSDEHRMVVYALPKADNSIVIPTRYSQRMPALFADEREDVELEDNLQNKYQTVDVYRPLVAGMCNTICLPFAIENKVGTPYENTRIFAFTGVKEGNDQVELQFTEVSEMQAGIPYLIQPESDITDLVRFTNVTPMAGTTPGFVTPDGSSITFHGAIDPTTLSVNQNFLFLVANNRLATASEGGDMLGMRGYFTVNGALPTKAIISFREGVATGVTSTIGETTDGVQKVLQNQQILIIRDGETYNILGEHINTK